MSEPRLHLESEGGIARITIDNPSKRNAMSSAMWRRLPDLLAQATADPEIRVVVVTGAGDAFCAGADISELSEIESPTANVTVTAERALLDCPLPTIALVNGLCIGGGCQLAAACDIRIASIHARFGVTPAKLGVVYPPSSIARLTGLVGPSAAKLLLYSADFINAEHAVRIRLADEVVTDPAARVAELAATIAGRSQLSVRAAKELIDLADQGLPMDDRAAYWQEQAESSGETAEGVRAFLDRRAPAFPFG